MSSIEVLGAAVDAFCAESIEDLTAGEALAVLARLEVVQRRLASRGLRLVRKMTGQASPVELGGTSFPEVLSRRLHMGKGRRAGGSLMPSSWCRGARSPVSSWRRYCRMWLAPLNAAISVRNTCGSFASFLIGSR